MIPRKRTSTPRIVSEINVVILFNYLFYGAKAPGKPAFSIRQLKLTAISISFIAVGFNRRLASAHLIYGFSHILFPAHFTFYQWG